MTSDTIETADLVGLDPGFDDAGLASADAASADAASAGRASAPDATSPAARRAKPAALPGFDGLRVAIVHDWLQTFAGSERVLEQLLLCFPEADLFAVVDAMRAEERRFLRGRPVTTSFIGKLPFARRHFRHYLGLMPLAVQQFDLRRYDLVISSSHAVAKGVMTGPDQVHIAYIHSPMRYIWDLQHQYLDQAGIAGDLRGAYARWLFARLRLWDAVSTNSVDVLVANSRYIARRIRKTYRREACVIHPPVDIDRFRPPAQAGAPRGDYYLLVSRFVPYKRADLVAGSFARTPNRRLVVVGDGPENRHVHAAARGAANIEFRGAVSQDTLIHLMQHTRALVFAAEEDFGITLVEAQACGTPVIAYGRGGAADIVIGPERKDPTGILFPRQDSESLLEALDRFEATETAFRAGACRANAERFRAGRFREAFLDLTLDAMTQAARLD